LVRLKIEIPTHTAAAAAADDDDDDDNDDEDDVNDNDEGPIICAGFSTVFEYAQRTLSRRCVRQKLGDLLAILSTGSACRLPHGLNANYKSHEILLLYILLTGISDLLLSTSMS
jgi:hypothetical protein